MSLTEASGQRLLRRSVFSRSFSKLVFYFTLSNEMDDNDHTSTGAPLAIEQKIDSEIILPRPRSRNNTLTKKSAA